MKLFYVNATDDDDVTNSLDFFVVAQDVDLARGLWKDAVLELMGRPALDEELASIFVVVEDASSLPVAAQGERWVPWDEFGLAWRRQR